MASTHHHDDAHDHQKDYIKVIMWLLIFTFLTVVAALDWIPASWGDYGNKLHIGIGLLIAFMKAAMVVYIFMHIKFDHKFIRLFIGIPLFLFSVMVFAFTALESFY
ncbi:MAG TPA: cytochrome C oxidase subunit IV family protein [Candidatus Kapabacteria bacterium]|jgi:cytochrome c oxidase subunit 4|nr:cytochrome C oxidase subunit IV family protein [Ignavibacteria bacterium]HRE56779.1 cytochrome C oxidase subunit IV family protein [Candidatus Kapabacteria bacterium]HRI30929.1 cytochrome C oxidase subunit IV family protein [Candidatus Kapabacteria bacterium]HRK59959.1 cytochrome C oxidase subunit IV family protein [Candidatus Kapabacteria bacterium]